jgi:hypothetical protein
VKNIGQQLGGGSASPMLPALTSVAVMTSLSGSSATWPL